MSPSLMAAQADAMLGVHLVTRNPAARWVGALVLVLVLAVKLGEASPTPVEGRAPVLWLVAGTVAAVSASRLLAPGAALGAARMASGASWVVTMGRLTGLLIVIIPVIGGVWLTLLDGAAATGAAGRALVGAVCLAAAVSGVTVAVTPVVGASAAATLGFVAVWLGGIAPQAVREVLAPWPAIGTPSFYLWHVVPLPWRASRWLVHGGWYDPLWFVGWFVLGVLGSSAVIDRRYRQGPRRVGTS